MYRIRTAGLLARDFVRTVAGRDYFHQAQPIGAHFTDARCYYNDLTGKAAWQGSSRRGVPLLYVARTGESVVFPIMVFQFGLGALDRYFLTGCAEYHDKALDAIRWAIANVNAGGWYDNLFPTLRPQHDYYSSNSAMAQGQAISLLTRAVRANLLPQTEASAAERAIAVVFENMSLPLEMNGTVHRTQNGVYLCEACVRPPHVVLNGWIFGAFGVLDYVRWAGSSAAGNLFDATVSTLERDIANYIQQDGWSAYDDNGRLASPFYHDLHIALLSALARLTGRSVLADAAERLRAGNSGPNRAKYTILKVIQRAREMSSHSTAH
jgi:heparosan-N-sulfate-glucuronate 5-epimerase